MGFKLVLSNSDNGFLKTRTEGVCGNYVPPWQWLFGLLELVTGLLKTLPLGLFSVWKNIQRENPVGPDGLAPHETSQWAFPLGPDAPLR